MQSDPQLDAVLAQCLAELDLSSADGRAGLRAALRHLEEAAPKQIEASAARVQRRRLGLPVRP
ncbi:MAG: hypothetical protein EON86_03150 [Brevundimonas sp.]|nr:MAG: hypothetical protein EON86_03150 [Brevundimonas sp.]